MNKRDLLQAGFRYAYSLTHNHHDAEDLVQDAWLKIYAKNGPIENKSLLFLSIRNLFIDRYRHNRLLHFVEYDEGVIGDTSFRASDADLTMEEIDGCLNDLRPEEREAIYLKFVEEFTLSEIAKLTERPRGTVLSLIYRGKSKLVRSMTYLLNRKKEKTGRIL